MRSSKEAFEEAHRVRREARKVRGKGAVLKVEPIIDDPDTVLADKTDNTVKASVLKDPSAELAIKIPRWANLPLPNDGQDILNVFHRIGEFEQEIYAGTFDQSNADDLPLRLVLKKETTEYGADGVHSFRFEITSFYDGQTYPSDPVTLIFDRIAPNHGEAPEAVPAIAEVIDGNVASVNVVLPDYPGRAAKDVVRYYWLASVPEDFDHVVMAGYAEVTEADQKLPIPENLIVEKGTVSGSRCMCWWIRPATSAMCPSPRQLWWHWAQCRQTSRSRTCRLPMMVWSTGSMHSKASRWK